MKQLWSLIRRPISSVHLHLPHVYTILFILSVIVALLTWIVPSGSYQRVQKDTLAGVRELPVDGTYKVQEKVTRDVLSNSNVDVRVTPLQLFSALSKGIQSAGDVVAFVLLVGGSISVINETGAFKAGLAALVKRFKSKDILLIPIMVTILSLCGTIFGFCEEALPFYSIFIPVMLGLGYDSMVAFMIVFMAPNVGIAASLTNPFTVLISQGIMWPTPPSFCLQPQ